jgi:hypothetical protein
MRRFLFRYRLGSGFQAGGPGFRMMHCIEQATVFVCPVLSFIPDFIHA